jgi:poly-gamma-glutamate synthesis protein (capsule biosynthesis protein)
MQIPDQSRVTFCAVGDVMLDRGIERAIIKHDIHYPFERIKDFTSNFDLAFCNLECPISEQGVSSGKIYCFRADTAYFAGPRNAGFNIYCLANNHIIDWGLSACFDTRDRIERESLYTVGIYKTGERPCEPLIISTNGLVFAFFAYLGAPLRNLAWPENKPGPAQAPIDSITLAIQNVREHVDFIIVSFHWGLEYIHIPNKQQIEWAHCVIDAGADLVIGHHPHVLQSIEHYRNRVILYSLGNFVFDQHKSYQRRTGIFSCIFKQGYIDSARFHPVWIEDYQPHLAHDSLYTHITSFMREISLNFNTLCIEKDSTLLLADSAGIVTINTPLRYAHTKSRVIEIYRNHMLLSDSTNKIIDSYYLPVNAEIKDCCFLSDSNRSIGVITGDTANYYGNTLALYTTTDTSIVQVWRQKIPDMQPWKVEQADLNNDGSPELCLGGYSKVGQTSSRTNRIVIYDVYGRCLFPKWPESHKTLSFIDFTVRDTDGDDLDELVILEKPEREKQQIVSYQWLGFGFFKYRVILECTDTRWLSDVY